MKVNCRLYSSGLGKAHVVTSSSGLADYVTHNETALTVPVGDSRAMQEAIELLLSNSELADKIGEAAKLTAMKHYREQVTVNYLHGILDQLISRFKTND